MSAAKKIILLLGFVLASLVTASALTPGATETRVGQKSFTALESRQAEPLQTAGRHQRNATRGYELAPESLLAAKTPKPTWPSTAQQMDDFLKVSGKRIADTPGTPGRGKVEWRPNPDTKITFEQHPYHPTAPDWHKGPHFHLDTPGIKPHQRYVPGDPIPGYP